MNSKSIKLMMGESNHDPKAKFALTSLTRQQIADALNDSLFGENAYTPGPTRGFAGDDPRLTDAVCRNFVTAVSENFVDIEDEKYSRVLVEVAGDFLQTLGVKQ